MQHFENKIKANAVLFFDMDGTLVDTNLANFLSYKRAIHSVTKANYRFTYDPDKRFNRASLKGVVPDLRETEYERIIQAKQEYYKDFLSETKLNKPVADILLKYARRNKTILVTNCRHDWASETLDYHGLTNQFNKIFCRRSRVDGELTNKFAHAISELGVSPELVIAFEDEESEVADAKRAGIQIINPVNI